MDTILHRWVFGALSSSLVLSCSAVRAQDSSDSSAAAQQAAYHSSMVQKSLQRDAGKLQAQVKSLLLELQTNGIKVVGMDALVAASDHLSDLDAKQMEQVIAQLQEASLASEDPKRQQALLGAYQGQKDLALQLKDMASQLSAEEAQNAIPLELRSLVKRQFTNIRQTTFLQTHTGSPDQVTSQHAVISEEQSSIRDHIALLVRHLIAADSPLAKAANAVLKGPELNDLAGQATQLTTQGVYDQAVAKQGDVKDYLVKMLTAVETQKDLSQRLSETEEQIDQMRSEEKQEQNATAQQNSDSAQLKDQQAKIADQASMTMALLAPLNSSASDEIKKSLTEMEKSLADLNAQNRDPAKADQTNALAALDKAKDLLAKQIADVRSKEDETPDQQLADLEKLKADVDQEKQNVSTPNAQDQTAQLNQTKSDASTQVPEAASKIGDAQNALSQPQADKGKASDLLSQASNAIQSKIDAVKADADAYAALAKMQSELSQASDKANSAQDNLNGADAKKMNETAQDLLAAQNHTESATQGSPQTPAEAIQAMKDAIDALKNAGNSTVQGNMPGAKQQTGKGLQSLAKAQSSIGKAMATLALSMNKKAGHGDKGGGTKFVSQMEINPTNHQKKAGDTGEVLGALSPVDRQAIAQYQTEKVVPDYAPQIQQYMKNLADSSTTSTP